MTMKQKAFFTGIFSLLLVFGLIFTGCKNDDDDGGTPKDDLLGTWKNANNITLEFDQGEYPFTCTDASIYSVSFEVEGSRIYVSNGILTFDYVLSGTTLTLSKVGGTIFTEAGALKATAFEGAYTKQ